MKATGIVRRIDDLGRVVVPKEIRRVLRIREGDPLEIYTGTTGEAVSYTHLIKIRYALTTVLVVLIGLYRYTRQSRVALDVIRLPEKSVSGGKSAFEKLFYIYLTTCGSQSEEIHVVDMDVSLSVSFGMLRFQHEHLIELLRAL